MIEIEYAQRLTRVEERAKSNTHQIEYLKLVITEIHTLSKTMVQLVEQVKNTNESIDNLREKVEILEKEPADAWKQLKTVIITAFVTALISAIAGVVLIL